MIQLHLANCTTFFVDPKQSSRFMQQGHPDRISSSLVHHPCCRGTQSIGHGCLLERDQESVLFPLLQFPQPAQDLLVTTLTLGKIYAHLLDQKSHWERLVKQSQLATLTLLIVRISEDPAVQERPMYIRDHGTNVSCAIG